MSHGAAAPPGSSCGRRGTAAGQGGSLTSLPVTEFTARHGKIPTKLSSPPLLQPDAEFWHRPGWQPLGRAAQLRREGGCAHPRPDRGTRRLQVQISSSL